MEVIKSTGKVQQFDVSKIERFIRIHKKENVDINIKELVEEVVSVLLSKRLDKITTKEIGNIALGVLNNGNVLKPKGILPKVFVNSYKSKPDPFTTDLGKFVYYRTYSRNIPKENRRETWAETVERVVNFNISLQLNAMSKKNIELTYSKYKELQEEAMKIYDLMFNLKLFPSGRTLWVGGTPVSLQFGLSNFNCSFMVLDELSKFSELFLLSMLGTGVGVSVEKKYIKKLPQLNSNIEIIHKDYNPKAPRDRKEHTSLIEKSKNVLEIEVGDSKYGWAKATEMYLDILTKKPYQNIEYILFNYDSVRGAGEPLKVFGGFASGHTALKNMFHKIDKLLHSKNQKTWVTLTALDCLDICTIIAENVVSGGTRRSAEIIFCDKEDLEIIEAKNSLYKQEGGKWIINPDITHRTLSNNTILYYTNPGLDAISKHLDKIKLSGEPGIGNMEAMLKRREDAQGANPCFEILLRDRGVCNLTEVNVMGFASEEGFDIEGLKEAQRLSARMGYRMATIDLELHEWNLVHAEDRLVGTSITGVMDAFNITKANKKEIIEILSMLKDIARTNADKLADELDLNRPKLVTCVKPSGTISQLPTVSSGMHYSHSPYFIRRVRESVNSPLVSAMTRMGYKYIKEDDTKVIFEFPVKAPKGKTKYDVSAIEQLEMYKLFMEHYAEQNCSNTIHVREHEWEGVKKWVYENWDSVVGLSFLALDDSFYPNLPYEAISEEKYHQMVKETPKFDESFIYIEKEIDETDLGSDCVGGVCPIR